jgi:hypothetical protein
MGAGWIMGGTGAGDCGPVVLAAKATCVTTMRAGRTIRRTSFFIRSPVERLDPSTRKQHSSLWGRRKYIIRCIPLALDRGGQRSARFLTSALTSQIPGKHRNRQRDLAIDGAAMDGIDQRELQPPATVPFLQCLSWNAQTRGEIRWSALVDDFRTGDPAGKAGRLSGSCQSRCGTCRSTG